MVVGDPIKQVRSTELYNKLASDKELDVVFIPLQFGTDDFEAAIAGLRVFKNLGRTTVHRIGYFICRRKVGCGRD